MKAAILTLSSVLVFTSALAQKRIPADPKDRPGYDRRVEQENKKHGWGEGRLKVGDPAPDFNLKVLDSQQRVRLSSFAGKKPVALIFGSYT